VLAYPAGVLGCMDVPESKDRHPDRIGHLESLLEIERVLSLAQPRPPSRADLSESQRAIARSVSDNSEGAGASGSGCV
jgi:hypothetical protein